MKATSNEIFEKAEDYDKLLQEGLKLSGETKEYFIHGRMKELKKRLPESFTPQRILDFGCGVGLASSILLQYFNGIEVVGSDKAEGALEKAGQTYATSNVSFVSLDRLKEQASFDPCYCSGVFHHIPPTQRPEILLNIFSFLKKGGYFAFFENNPINPGTRLIMKRVAFDKDAITLFPNESKSLITSAGFQLVGIYFLFYFPKVLAFFRPIEKALKYIPLGAQYFILARKP